MLDPRSERAERYAGFLKALTIEGDRVREDRIAQLSEVLKREIPKVGNDRFKLVYLLPLQAHHASLRRVLEERQVCVVVTWIKDNYSSHGRHRRWRPPEILPRVLPSRKFDSQLVVPWTTGRANTSRKHFRKVTPVQDR
jgi:hypothetical protein